MENDELKEFLKMDFPDYKVDNEKIISLCRKSEKKNRVSKSIIFKLALGLSCVVLVMMVTLLINYNNINRNISGEVNIEPKTNLTMGGDSINTDFFVIDVMKLKLFNLLFTLCKSAFIPFKLLVKSLILLSSMKSSKIRV